MRPGSFAWKLEYRMSYLGRRHSLINTIKRGPSSYAPNTQSLRAEKRNGTEHQQDENNDFQQNWATHQREFLLWSR